jgi:hypothetical protein
MWDENIVSDNTDDLSSLFDGSVTADVSVATMPTGTRGSTEPTSGVDDAVDNQQDWYDFDGDINDLLSSRPPTYLRQSKLRKSSHNGIATKYEYRFCYVAVPISCQFALHVMDHQLLNRFITRKLR